MERIHVESSCIKSVGYDRRREVLEIEFHSGHVYRYLEVPLYIFEYFMQASSKGSFFSRYIREDFATQRVA